MVLKQWNDLYAKLKARCAIEMVEPRQGLPDMVFTANAGLILGNKAIVSRFYYPERQGEEKYFKEWFQNHGYTVYELPEKMYFEGAGDALLDRGEAGCLWAGYGFRSSLESHAWIAATLEIEVVSLKLVDSRFYHLDTCFCPLEGGYLLYFPQAFDESSNRTIESRVPADKRIVLSEADALHFGCNAVNIGKLIVFNEISQELKTRLNRLGFEIEETPLTEFLKAGGACKCLTLKLDEPRDSELKNKNAVLQEVTQDGVAPDDFYATTIYHTEVLVAGKWLPVQNQRMDGCIVVTPDAATVKLIRDLKRGQQVVVGLEGVKTLHPSELEKSESESQDGGHDFAFMGAGVSSERRGELVVRRVATEMEKIRQRGGRIVVVAGPVVVHTGGGEHLAALIREGYVQALLGGNAIAVHDIEEAVLGTSLGVDVMMGHPVQGGHRHHLRAINLIRRCGSIAAAVEQGLLKSGVMYECVRNEVPFSLAGSIRDDGPLPETKMDLVAAQEEYAKLLKGADLVLMLSSMLHSIGVGNMTPAGVKLICVDINPAVVTKLSDRGSVESIGVVTDVGLFLSLLHRQLQTIRTEQEKQ